MMFKLWCCCLILLSSLEGIPPARELYADIGEKVELFSSIAADKYKKTSLYAVDRNGKLIAEWTSGKEYSYMNHEYIGKIYMDQNGSIWMRHVDQDDVGTYSVKYDHITKGPVVKLNVSRKLIEEQIREEINKYLGNLTVQLIREEIKKYLGNLTEQLIREEIKKYLGNLTEQQIREEIKKYLVIHNTVCSTESEMGSSIPVFISLLVAIFIIVSLHIILTNKNAIKNGMITMQHWIHQRLPWQHSRHEHSPQPQEPRVVHCIVPAEAVALLSGEPTEDSANVIFNVKNDAPLPSQQDVDPACSKVSGICALPPRNEDTDYTPATSEQPSPGQEGPANVRNNAVEGESCRLLGNILSEEHAQSDQLSPAQEGCENVGHTTAEA